MRFLFCLFTLLIISCSTTLNPVAEAPPLTTMLDEQHFTLPNTEQEVMLQLSTSAHSEQNQVHWDDSQHWRLTLSVNNRAFILHDAPIAIGQLDYWAYTQNEDFYIATLVAASAQVALTVYRYLPQKQRLQIHHAYRTQGNTNLLRQSPGQY